MVCQVIPSSDYAILTILSSLINNLKNALDKKQGYDIIIGQYEKSIIPVRFFKATPQGE